jgi:Tfp pilus assembly protein PilO
MSTPYEKYFKTVALVWASCFILSLLIYVMAISPQRKGIEQLEQQITEKRQLYEAILKINQHDTQIAMKEQMEQWRGKLKDFIATPEEMAGLTFDIGQIANSIKVDAFSVKPQSDRESQGVSSGDYIRENQINVKFKASFNKFAAFLNAMERHRPVIFVDKFVINRVEQEELTNQVNMDLLVFVQKQHGS